MAVGKKQKSKTLVALQRLVADLDDRTREGLVDLATKTLRDIRKQIANQAGKKTLKEKLQALADAVTAVQALAPAAQNLASSPGLALIATDEDLATGINQLNFAIPKAIATTSLNAFTTSLKTITDAFDNAKSVVATAESAAKAIEEARTSASDAYDTALSFGWGELETFLLILLEALAFGVTEQALQDFRADGDLDKLEVPTMAEIMAPYLPL
jgi:hypothetical protein